MPIFLSDTPSVDAAEPATDPRGGGMEEICECGHSADTHDPCCVSACGCDGFEPREPSVADSRIATLEAQIRDAGDYAERLQIECSELKTQLVSAKCPHVVTSDENTSYCALAEDGVKKLEARLSEERGYTERLQGSYDEATEGTEAAIRRAEKAESDAANLRQQLAQAKAALVETIEDATEGTEAAIHRAEKAESAEVEIAVLQAKLADQRAANDRAVGIAAAEANRQNDKLRGALVKIEAWMASEEGPLCKLWEDGDIGNYDDVPPTDWEQTLFDVRDWTHGCVPTASLGYGTEWPVITLYREILAALAPESAESSGESGKEK